MPLEQLGRRERTVLSQVLSSLADKMNRILSQQSPWRENKIDSRNKEPEEEKSAAINRYLIASESD